MSSTAPLRSAGHLQGGDRLPRSGGGLAGVVALDDAMGRSSEATGLSPGEFADTIAGQLGLPRISLSDLLALTPLAEHFSRRFLRETMVFPFESAQHAPCLAVADPRDTAAGTICATCCAIKPT